MYACDAYACYVRVGKIFKKFAEILDEVLLPADFEQIQQTKDCGFYSLSNSGEMFKPNLQINDRLKNQELCDVFKCSPQGGMRRSNRTNSLVIVSNHYTSIYEDRWIGDVLHYTGMGQSGDQDIDRSQNRTLKESAVNGVAVFLFEVYGPKGSDYHYRGQVKLAAEPYQEDQLDENSEPRRVWVFPLKPVGTETVPILEQSDLIKLAQHQESVARKMSNEELERCVLNQPPEVGRTQVITTTWQRNALVVEYAKRRAAGICELCNSSAPFEDKHGKPYLEVHHIIWLSNDGSDTIDNVAALCPNCHRRMHSLNSRRDIAFLKAKRQKDDPHSAR